MKPTFKIGWISHRTIVPFALEKKIFYYTELTFVHDGVLNYKAEDGTVMDIHAGQAFFCTRGHVRERLQGKQVATYTSIIVMHKEPLDFTLPTIINNTDTKEINHILDVCIEMCSYNDDYFETKCDGIVRYLFGILLQICLDQTENPVVRKIKKYIANNYKSKITLDDICNHVHLSRSHTQYLFTKETGTTLIQYIINTRIDKAKHLLISSEDSMKEIALQTGFNDCYYFSRAFKSVTGKTPSNFKKDYFKGSKQFIARETGR